MDEAGKGNLEEQLKGMGEKTANGGHCKGRWSRGGQAGQEGAAKPASTKAGGLELHGGSCLEPQAALTIQRTAVQ